MGEIREVVFGGLVCLCFVFYFGDQVRASVALRVWRRGYHNSGTSSNSLGMYWRGWGGGVQYVGSVENCRSKKYLGQS